MSPRCMAKMYTYRNANYLKEKRQFLRTEANLAEKILWKHLRREQMGYKFRRQYSIGNVIADFCSVPIQLIIEIDGWTHDSEKTKTKDTKKEWLLESYGYKILRFTNEQIYGDIEPVLREIKSVCQKREREIGECSANLPPPSPSP